jgi:dTDP-glucose 4,6-dehydratase
MLGERAPWAALRRARILMTGGTGFVGAWMVATALEVDQRLDLGLEFVLLTRSRRALAARLPWMVTDHRVTLVVGDVNECAWPAGPFTHVVAGAAAADAAANERDPEAAYRAIVAGTRRTLEEAARHAAPRTLMLSSGAVYGDSLSRRPVSEDTPTALGGPQDSGYHAGKRAAEGICREAAAGGLPVSIARLFAFLGAYLPLDRHFAVGNFVADALRGGPVVVSGDGSPVRSYLYGCDMALWLWTILLAGRTGQAYNVGSERHVTIGEIARIVASAARQDVTVEVRGRPGPAGGSRPTGGGGAWYVPSTEKAREELGLDEWTSLEQGVARMIAWYDARGES